jgi:hypothetical protein
METTTRPRSQPASRPYKDQSTVTTVPHPVYGSRPGTPPEPEPAGLLHEVSVFGLLTASAVLLAFALARLSVAAGVAGVVAYLTSALIDQRRERRRPSRLHVERS